MATMLYRYAGECGFDLTERADITSFPDAGDVSSYAADAVSWANAVGLINGNRKKDGKVYIDPKSNATRAQVAAILMRFCENVAE